MSIAVSKKPKVVKVDKSISDRSKLINFLQTTKLPILKKLFEDKLTYLDLNSINLYKNLLEEQIPYIGYGDKLQKIGLNGYYSTIKQAECFLAGYLDVESESTFLVSKDLTCCGVTHFLGFNTIFTDYLKPYLNENQIKLIPEEYSIKKAKNFYKETIFQYMIFRTLISKFGFGLSIKGNKVISVKELIKEIKQSHKKQFLGTYQYKSIVAPSRLFLIEEDKCLNSDTKANLDNIKLCDSQASAYLALKELPYFEEKSRFINKNSAQTCINYEALFHSEELLEVLEEYQKLWENNLI